VGELIIYLIYLFWDKEFGKTEKHKKRRRCCTAGLNWPLAHVKPPLQEAAVRREFRANFLHFGCAKRTDGEAVVLRSKVNVK
jgi:hypothetical protein